MDLTELADRVRIAETLSAYCDCIDRSDLAALADVFTEDVQMDMGHGAVFSGRERLLRLVQELTSRWETTHHQCSNHLVHRYDGAGATVTSYVYAFHHAPGRDETMHLWGHYADELVQQDGVWRIRVRRLRVAGVSTTASSPFPDRFERLSR
jgi:ketosteroid isomerase-like protein